MAGKEKKTKSSKSGIILIDIASFTSRDLVQQIRCIELLNEVIQVALGEGADLLKKQWPPDIVNKGVWRVSRAKGIKAHNTGDGYFLVFKEFIAEQWNKPNLQKDNPPSQYCTAVLHAACAIRDWLLQLNVSENKGYSVGSMREKLNFRMVVHFGEYATPKGVKLGNAKGTRLLIGSALNDAARMIAMRGEGTLNTMYVSEQLYEHLPVRWRHSYFDGSLILDDDSKGIPHQYYKCVPPPAWECNYLNGEMKMTCAFSALLALLLEKKVCTEEDLRAFGFILRPELQ